MVNSLAADVANQAGYRLRSAGFGPVAVLPAEREWNVGERRTIVLSRRRALETRVHESVRWAEVVFCPGDWPKDAPPLRTVVLRIERRQLDLGGHDESAPTVERIKHLAVISNDFTMRADALVRWHWQKAGKVEIAHDVLKNELGAGTLPCAQFGSNAAWFRLCLLTYNVLSAMKTLALPPALADARPKRLRFSVFALPARILSHGRRLYARAASVFIANAELLAARARLLLVYCERAAAG